MIRSEEFVRQDERPMLTSDPLQPSFPTITYVHLLQQLYLRQCYRHRRQLPHWHIHPLTSHVSGRPACSSHRVLDEEVDRHNAIHEAQSSNRGLRFLYLLRADLLVCILRGDQPFPLEVGAVRVEWCRECLAYGGSEEGG